MFTCRTLAIASGKGGVAKTTTAVNLAAALGELGRRVLVVDLDPATSASSWLARPDPGRGLLDALTNGGSLAGLIQESRAPGVDLIPASQSLAAAEKALAGEVGAETLLREALSRLAPDRWDLVLMDCPPALGLLAIWALVACREVLMPLEPHPMAMAGLAQMLRTVETVRTRLNPDLAVAGIVVCRGDPRTRLYHEAVAELDARYAGLLFATRIRQTIRLSEAPSHGLPITQYSASSHGAEDYRALARELEKRGPA
jgi:chromosome partitioning protein